MSNKPVTIESVDGRVGDSSAPPERVLTLNHPEVRARLDKLFAARFGRPRHRSLRIVLNHAVKRLIDVVVATVGLLFLWPVLLVAGLATLCDTGRPVTYSQIRRIRHGRRVRIHKMRTLVVGADRNLTALVSIKSNGRFLNIDKAASSYTRVGRVLERLWIVELPQLWGVLRGHLSLVGNRPIPDYVIEALGTTPEVLERFASPQGLTGYVQVIGRDEVTDRERIQLEHQYSRVYERGNVLIDDLRTLGLTVLAYLGLGRRRTAADFLGPRRAVASESSPPVTGEEAAQAVGDAQPVGDAKHVHSRVPRGSGWALGRLLSEPCPRGLRDRIQKADHQLRIAVGARSRGRVHTGPLYVQIGVVNNCNYRCQFCWDHPSYVPEGGPHPDGIAEDYYAEDANIDRNRAHMSWEMFTALVDDLHEMRTRKIKFVGRGEPFLHGRFLDMVRYAKERGFNCAVTSNGTLITDDQVRSLVEMGLDELFVSVNAGSAKSYSEIHLRTPPTAFDSIKRTLMLFTSEKRRQGVTQPFMHLSFVIQNNNYTEMPDMVRLAHDVGAQRVDFSRIIAYQGTKFLTLNREQLAAALDVHLVEAERLARQFGTEINGARFRSRPGEAEHAKEIHTTTPCYIGWYFSIILADGSVNPCCQCLRTMGSLETQRFTSIWHSEAYRKFRGEITDLPKRGKELSGCRCYECGFATHNLSLHKFIHPLSRTANGQASFAIRDLKRFVSG